MQLLGIFLVGLLTACGHANASPQTPAAPVPAAAVVEDRLGIAPLEVFFNGVLTAKMNADGSVDMGENPDQHRRMFQIHTDGTIVTPGGARGRLREDGRLETPSGTLSRFTLEGERVSIGGRQLTLDEDGVVVLDPPIGGTPPRAQGVTSPATRRTALLLIAMLIDAGSH